MHNLEMRLEYNMGENIFVVKKEKVIADCPMCAGDGNVGWFNDRDEVETFRCPKCHGTGKVYGKKKLIPVVEPCKIIGIKVELKNDDTAVLTYKVTNGTSTFNRTSDLVFCTLEDAKMFCEKENNIPETKMVSLDDIKIVGYYDESHPSPAKVTKKIEEYQETGSLKYMEVNKDMELVDGYITYKIAKMFNIKEVEVKVVT